MITISVDDFNSFSQDGYDERMDSIDPAQFQCTCGISGSLIRYGSYHRHVKTGGFILKLRISRVRCEACGRTHAILPSSIVPYSQIPLNDQTSVAEAFERGASFSPVLDSNPQLDDRTPFKLIRKYLACWRERLRAERIRLRPLSALVRDCLSLFHRQFMQIKNTPNIFFSPPT